MFNNTNPNRSTASVVDGTLILTLPEALRPCVWQMQLGQTKSSALEVRDQEDGSYLLVLKTPRSEFLEIAPFAHKARAVDALMAVSRAMERAHGQLQAYNPATQYPMPAVIPQRSAIARFFRVIGFCLLFLVAAALLLGGFLWLTRDKTGSSTAVAPVEQGDNGLQQMSVPPASAPEPIPGGEPVSAEDFLNNQ